MSQILQLQEERLQDTMTMQEHFVEDEKKQLEDVSSEETDPDSLLNESNSSTRKLLSRKAQQTLRKIRSLKKVLLDDSLWAEIEDVLGKVSFDSISNTEINQDDNASGISEGGRSANESSQESKTMEDVVIENAEISDAGVFTQQVGHGSFPAKGGTSDNSAAVSFSRNVSFAQSVSGTSIYNTNLPRKGNLHSPSPKTSITPPNPYLKKADTGILHANCPSNGAASVDKIISLKENNKRLHIHRYTLSFKTIKAKSEYEGHQIVQDTLQRFVDIILQADQKSIIPPYLELDHNDKSVSDLSAAFPVCSIDSYHAIEKYFFRLSARDEGGLNWCSIVLAQSIPFVTLME